MCTFTAYNIADYRNSGRSLFSDTYYAFYGTQVNTVLSQMSLPFPVAGLAGQGQGQGVTIIYVCQHSLHRQTLLLVGSYAAHLPFGTVFPHL